MTELVVIISLLGVIVFQQWFYLKQIDKFTDKIMAGNYHAYAQSQAYVNESLKAPTAAPNGFNIQLPHDEEFDELSQLNSMLTRPL